MITTLRRVAPCLAVLLALGVTAAHAEPIKCQREIVKRSAKFSQQKTKLLQKCEDLVLKGKIAGPCPDIKAATKIAQAESKLRAAVAKRCGGSDRTCGTGDDDTLASIGWDLGACPDFEQSGCDTSIGDCDDVAECLACVDNTAVDQAIDLYYDAFTPAPSTTVLRCQRSLGKEGARALGKKGKALRKCEDDILKGKIAGPCPDARAAAQIARADVKLVDRVCKSCGGDDKECGTGGDDLTVAEIGFVTTCPNVTVPGGGSCAGPITDLPTLVECVRCVTAFKSDCIDAISVPGLKNYPAECGGVVATPTPTPTPTVTSTATLSPTPIATPPCGNNVAEGAEECDGTDDAACPGECQTNCQCPQPCTIPNPLPEVVSFIAKPGIDLDSGWTGISHDSRGVDDGSLLAVNVKQLRHRHRVAHLWPVRH